MRKLRKKIYEKSANVSMNETLVNLLQQNRAKKLGREKRKEYTTRCVSHEEKPQEEQQTVLSRKCNNLGESSNDKSSDAKENDGTT